MTDPILRQALRKATNTALLKRKEAFNNDEDFQRLRRQARSIRLEVIERLSHYLHSFRSQAITNGAHVYDCDTSESARRQISSILLERGAKRVVKSKSMVTEEIGLYEHLEASRLAVVETDLGEYIVSLAGEKPSHLTAPAIHKTRSQVGRLFHEKLGAPYSEDPHELAAFARERLRREFLQAEAGITGANFVLADAGSIVLFTNEGNGRMCTVLPRVHIAVISPEKIIPSLVDLDVFMKLLPGSATGQSLTTYLSVITGTGSITDGYSDGEVHIVIVDNGRSLIAQSDYRDILTCIRCGACMNVCPVYTSVGGHAYNSTYVGPMGIVLSILLFGMDSHHTLTDACTLCGACDAVCPVLVPISTLIARLRTARRVEGLPPLSERIGMTSMATAFRSPLVYRLAQRVLTSIHSVMGKKMQTPSFLGRLPTPGDPPFHGRFRQ